MIPEDVQCRDIYIAAYNEDVSCYILRLNAELDTEETYQHVYNACRKFLQDNLGYDEVTAGAFTAGFIEEDIVFLKNHPTLYHILIVKEQS